MISATCRAALICLLVSSMVACSFRQSPRPAFSPVPSPSRRNGSITLPKSTSSRTGSLSQTVAANATQTAQQLTGLNSATPSATSPTTDTGPSPTAAIDPLACLPPGAVQENAGEIGLVSWIQDADTIVVDFQGRRSSVRLIGLDSPPIAAQKLKSLLENQVARVFRDASSRFANDARGTPYGYVLTADGSFINYEMLRQGEARLDGQIQGYACQEVFAAAETAAKTAKIGLWGVQAVAALPSPTPAPTRAPATAVALIPTATPTTSPAAPTATLAPGVTPTITPITLTPQPSNTLLPGVTPSLTAPSTSATPPPPTATATIRSAPSTATATASGEGESDIEVVISNIYWSGTESKNESDEYIELHNTGSDAFDLGGWSVYAEDTFAELFFPAGFSLAAGAFCRVYTNEIHSDSCAQLSFGHTEEAWPNDFSCGGLYNPKPDEMIIAYYCY